MNFCDECLWGVLGGNRDKCLDIGSDPDHHADYPIKNQAITQPIMNELQWNVMEGTWVVKGTSHYFW